MEIEIGESEIDLNHQRLIPMDGAGALVEFTGIVRAREEGRLISALRYEAYQPMAENQIRKILNELMVLHSCLGVKVVHRIGVIPVGQAAIYIGIESVHRAEAFAVASNFMDRLKQDVPIWKTEVIA